MLQGRGANPSRSGPYELAHKTNKFAWSEPGLLMRTVGWVCFLRVRRYRDFALRSCDSALIGSFREQRGLCSFMMPLGALF